MRNIIVCDFDGTLLNRNSFPLWISFITKRAFLKMNWVLFIRLIWLLFLRKLLRFSHSFFKRKLIMLNVPQDYNEEFVISLKPYINQDLINILKETTCVMILSTAAPSSYAKYLKNIIPFAIDKEYFSYVEKGKLIENYGKEKVTNLLNDFGKDIDFIVYTDHYEDIPLITSSKQAYLVNPSTVTLNKLQELNVSYKLLNTRVLT